MVCSPDDLAVWRDFPKGLRVLLIDNDGSSAEETKLKLEAMDYIVSSFCNERDALEAIYPEGESFHVAIVEVTVGSIDGGFKFLEMARDLPTIVISSVTCLNTMMKCIALGAAEFLQKPLSEDKLRNIWQHVVHKAFNAGESDLSKSLKPIKETVASMLQLQKDTAELKIDVLAEGEKRDCNQGSESEDKVGNDRLSAPSTPQLKQGGRFLDDGDCQEQPNCSTEKESTDETKCMHENRQFSCSETEFLNITCNNSGSLDDVKEVLHSRPKEAGGEEEVESADGSKIDECIASKQRSTPSQLQTTGNLECSADNSKKKKSYNCGNTTPNSNRASRKKIKVDWTPELHRRFVQAVEQLGVEQAIPSKILELMKVEGLTRHNVASHLQKYRMHRRHILPKDDERRWQLHKDYMSKGYMQKPIVAIHPYHSNYAFPPTQAYPVWGHPGYNPSAAELWGHPGFPAWHPPPESWSWKPYSAVHADAWGCPVFPQYGQYSMPAQTSPASNQGFTGGYRVLSKDSCDINLAEEVIDEVMREAMSKPWLPLPLGLKPPSTDSVLAELHRQGIRTIPPPPPHRR